MRLHYLWLTSTRETYTQALFCDLRPAVCENCMRQMHVFVKDVAILVWF